MGEQNDAVQGYTAKKNCGRRDLVPCYVVGEVSGNRSYTGIAS